jgi:hypothetical protein
MTSSLFQFGERIAGYDIPVLNERAVRASAGILFLFAIVAFMNAWLLGNFQPTRVFVVAFLAEFTIRLFINPRYAPTLIVGQWLVRRQRPEWVGAPQKRFAWAIGFVLALVMLWLVVIQQVIGPVNLLVCAACLTLLFFESAFGICLGCKLYNLFGHTPAQLCPGGVCEVPAASGFGLSAAQALVLVFFGAGLWAVAHQVYAPGLAPAVATPATAAAPAVDAAEAERCKVPEFAKAIGHEEMWKLHNNCK